MTMDAQLDALVEALSARLSVVPVSVDLWGVEEIASFLKLSYAHVRDKITPRPDFPAPREIPGTGGRPIRRWKAQEVIDWAERKRRRNAKST